MTRPPDRKFHEFGFSAFTFRWEPDRAHRWNDIASHTHLELEMQLLEHGSMMIELGGTLEELRPCEAVLLWGGMPHRTVTSPVASVLHVAQMPVAVALTWGMGPALDRLFSGELLRDEVVQAGIDPLLFGRWPRDLRSDRTDLKRAAELELEARVRRLFANNLDRRPDERRPRSPTADGIAQAITFVTRHFTDTFGVDDVAAVVGWHRAHLMTSFRQICGITLWDYVTRLRTMEAERLLATTDLPVLEVCHRAGFGSPSRMYEAFARIRATTPAGFRSSLR